MAFLYVDTSGLEYLRMRLMMGQERITPAVEGALEVIGTETTSRLSDAAPKGANPGPAIAGDSDGPLAESFVSEATPTQLTVRTIQPAKLRFVREGRGPVRPVKAKALYWQGLDHPVKFAGPAAANDFVTPVLKEIIPFATETLSEAVGEALTIIGG